MTEALGLRVKSSNLWGRVEEPEARLQQHQARLEQAEARHATHQHASGISGIVFDLALSSVLACPPDSAPLCV